MANLKKHIILVVSVFSIFGLSGCGGGGSSSNDYIDDGLTTLFLVDENGFSYGGVPYICDSMSTWDVTAPNGEFSFYPQESCEFDFTGLNGTDPTDPFPDNLIYIVDYLDYGKNGIPYECQNFNVGILNTTYYDGISDGSFDYDVDDACVFYL